VKTILRHPIAFAFAAAVVICLVLCAVALVLYPAQQVPWALAMAAAAFPFLWFFAWIAINGMAWWQDLDKGQ
jgi:hypothetical protein